MAKNLKINIVGGGPGGLYFAILMKLQNSGHNITVFEQNKTDDTFGFGVVFSDETLENFMGQDPVTYKAIKSQFAYWDHIEVRYRGEVIRSGGHGFAGMARMTLLNIFRERCVELGVEIKYESVITDLSEVRAADLVVAADGVNSFVRNALQNHLKPRIDIRKTKFVWLGTTQKFDAFTFIFKENEHGWFYNHAYQYGQGVGKAASTWILETHEDTWQNAGLDKASEDETIAYFEELFKEELDGHRIVSNKSVWRNFPVISAEKWSHENIVLIGDAVHTAQFSIGSGTKIAMEDAIALSGSVVRSGFTDGNIHEALTQYETERKDIIARLQRTALVSLSWYENARRYNVLSPKQYAFNFLSRNKGVTYENLKLRDPVYGADINHWYSDLVRKNQGFEISLDNPPPPMFTPFSVGQLTLQNRVVVAPMCQYSAKDGTPTDWQLVHLGNFAKGGAGLVITEMTNVSPEGRISHQCTGLYHSDHVPAWRRIVDFVHNETNSKICVQLGHAGRKASCNIGWIDGGAPLKNGKWQILAPSSIPFSPTSAIPKEMDRSDMDKVRDDYVRSAQMAAEAGFDMIEFHGAHGYLLSSFISPISNVRTDNYGGSLENRMRFPLEVLSAVRDVWPSEKPISVRISAEDWVGDRGNTGAEAVIIAKLFYDTGADIIHVSAGQTSSEQKPIYGRMFQTHLSEQVRLECGIPTMAVGNITTPDQINTILAAGRADLVTLARPHLANPFFTLHAAAHYNWGGQVWPNQYLRGKDQAFKEAEVHNLRQKELLLANKPKTHSDEV
ncbi:FAD-dependent monooxygenase [Rhodospirillales bacterium]|nr:FAD-dependent monooxygenase [Rhodospirillales bacterium]